MTERNSSSAHCLTRAPGGIVSRPRGVIPVLAGLAGLRGIGFAGSEGAVRAARRQP
jgi:hypothetical protein